MHPLPLIPEITTILVVGVTVALVLARLRLPTVAGLLAAGALIGPHGFGLVHDTHAIEVLAEVGVVLLLFTIGLEFSLHRLRSIFAQVAIGGTLQVGGTIAAVLGIALLVGVPLRQAVFYGFVFALSSTAIVLRALMERRELDAPHGRFIVGVLIFQDLCVVPMVLIVPLLVAGESASGGAIALLGALGRALIVVVGVLGASRWVLPPLLRIVDQAQSRDMFVLAVLALCIGTAWLTSLAGLSLALGAFLGGMMVADTEYGHRATGDMLPLRDVFVSVFFVSLGMLFDSSVVASQPLLTGLLLCGFIAGKGAIATIAATAMRFPPRVAWLAGVGLAQFGEFGFVLAKLGLDVGVVTEEAMSPLLAAGIASMFLTPVLVRAAPHFSAGERLLAPLARMLGARGINEATQAEEHVMSGHVVVIGYGVAGRLIGKALDSSSVAWTALEINSDSVRQARERGEPVFYADASSREALAHAHVAEARAVVVTMNDRGALARTVDSLRTMAPGVPVLVRTHFLADREALEHNGASDVIIEEVEAGLEMLARVLRRMNVPRNLIESRMVEARESTAATERRTTLPRPRLGDLPDLADLKIEHAMIEARSWSVGRTLREIDLRRETGALVVAIRRGAQLVEHPDPNQPLVAGEEVFLVGSSSSCRRAIALLTRGMNTTQSLVTAAMIPISGPLPTSETP
jgi:CPA2 family monovalent cation:H+ antiporter-2